MAVAITAVHPEGYRQICDTRGRCDGEVATWCNDRGQLETRDCSAQGETCRLVDDDTGFFCADP